jgi:transposase InsO family protein
LISDYRMSSQNKKSNKREREILRALLKEKEQERAAKKRREEEEAENEDQVEEEIDEEEDSQHDPSVDGVNEDEDDEGYTVSQAFAELAAQNDDLRQRLEAVEANSNASNPVPAASATAVTLHATADVVFLREPNHDNVDRFLHQFVPGHQLEHLKLIPDSVKRLISIKLLAKGIAEAEWQSWDIKKLGAELRLMYPADQAASNQTFLQQIQQFPMKIDLRNPAVTDATITSLIELQSRIPPTEWERDERSAVAILVKEKLGKGDAVAKHVAKKLGLHTSSLPDTVDKVCVDVYTNVNKMIADVAEVSQYATITLPGDVPKDGKSKGKPKNNNTEGDSSGNGKTLLCWGCGRVGHGTRSCLFSGGWHPNVNKTKTPWAQSVNGKAFAAKGILHLPWNKDLEDRPVIVPAAVAEKRDKAVPPAKKADKRRGDVTLDSYLHAILHTSSHDDFIKCHLSVPLQETTPLVEVHALLDNGALGPAGNYISLEIASQLLKAGGTKRVVEKNVVGALTQMHGTSKGSISFTMTFTSEQHNLVRFNVDAFIIDSPINLILGRQTIKDNNLVSLFPSHFYNNPPTHSGAIEGTESMIVEDALLPSQPRSSPPSVVTTMMLKHLEHPSEAEYFAPAFESFESVIANVNPQDQHEDVLDFITIYTDDDLTLEDVRSLLEEYRDIFSETLPPEPAKVPPLELTVDETAWETPKHHLPPRPQTPANQIEIKRQLDLLIAQNIVRSSNAPYYSQVHLAEKPPKGSGKKRFCIDYVLLNLCTKSLEKWPLPNIQQTLQRLGAKRPRYFAVLDLTAGYHQAPMSLASIAFTAFICFCGLYEYLRVPFGLKGAPSYFQRVMANVVLAGLIYIICEVYIDDIIVPAQTASEFLQNLRQVFERIRKHNIVLHPKKVRIGMPSVEYTGHIIDRSGISFSQTKIKQVLDFPLPRVKRHIKQFLGLANYFRDHIKNHSIIVAPLQKYLKEYTKRAANHAIILDDEAIAAFQSIKSMIEDCPTLFFLDDTSPVFLYTDACKYGMGGYLVQMLKATDSSKEIERPIAFMSASFNTAQLKWDIPQKEAYAIFASIQKFEYLLRDRYFIIKTDHRNITFINTSLISSVRKWKIYISEFDHGFDYTKGEDNVVADHFSRLVADNSVSEHDDDPLWLCAFPEGRIRIPNEAYRLIAKVHNSTVGHHGLERTLVKLTQLCSVLKKDPWVYMRQHVKQFIKQCPCCQKMSFLKLPIAAHPFTVSSYTPMDRLMMDYLGPFPDGKYILNILDCFSRWTELYLCEQATAQEAARCLLQHIGRFGAPTQIVSDRGSHFVADVIKELLAIIGVEHCLNIAYSKEESALVERQNKEVNRHLRALFFDRAIIEEYALCIPLVQRILNASTTARTGVAPCQLLFGNAVNLDRGIFLPQAVALSATSVPLSEPSSKMLQLQSTLLSLAEQHLQEADDAHIASYSAARTEFPVDSYVLLDYPTDPPTRLHTKKRGPYKVIRFSGNDYVLRDLVTMKELTVNITRLSPFHYDPLHTDPRTVANKDQGVFDIEKIITHDGNTNRKSTLRFLVRWRGFGPADDTWEPWKHVRLVKPVHDYLRSKGLDSLIPKTVIA